MAKTKTLDQLRAGVTNETVPLSGGTAPLQYRMTVLRASGISDGSFSHHLMTRTRRTPSIFFRLSTASWEGWWSKSSMV